MSNASISPPPTYTSSSSDTLTPPPAGQEPDSLAASEWSTGSRTEGDTELATVYGATLRNADEPFKNVKIHPIPPHSSFGQWWRQLRNAFQSNEIIQWIQEKGIDAQSIKLNPMTGEISFRQQRHLDPKQIIHKLGLDDPTWAAISLPILAAGRVIAAGNADTFFAPPTSIIEDPVPYELVGRFYKERLDLAEPAMRKRAEEINSSRGFTALDPKTDSSLIDSRSEDALQNQKTFSGDIDNRYIAAIELNNLASAVQNGVDDHGQIEAGLKAKLTLSPNSTYTPSSGERNKVTLLQFLQDHGLDIPTDYQGLVNLASALTIPSPMAPVNGNLGGALSWPVPLDQNGREQLQTDIRAGKFGDVTLSPFANVLDYLLNNRPIDAMEQRNPRRLIENLINSPRGMELGKAIQATFEARGVKGSGSDWLIAALNLDSASGPGKDPSSQASGEIEGYRLVSADNARKPASTVVKELADHLVAKGKASSPEKAAIRAHLLLANQAPEFLVKDIPDQVVVGTHSWVSFATATERIEAQSPGATATMSYVQIMLHASIAPINDEERHIEYVAQYIAINDWGVANGMNTSSEAAMAEVRKVFTTQVSELREAAETDIGEMPTIKSMTEESLKAAFPGMDPKLFDEKCITLQPSNRHFPGPYSMRDLYIDGRGLLGTPNSADDWGKGGRAFVKVASLGLANIPEDGKPNHWVSSSNAININDVLTQLKGLPRPQEPFTQAFADYSAAVKKKTSAHIKHVISMLSLEDQKNLQLGKITVRKGVTYPKTNQPKPIAEGVLLIQTERNGKTVMYEIDRMKGTVTKLAQKPFIEYDDALNFTENTTHFYNKVKLAGSYSSELTDERKGAQETPDSFSSARTQYIVDAMIEDMDLPGVEQYAKGATTFDTEVPLYKVVSQVALNLIPFWSAIQNFRSGNVGAGVLDLAFDIFGFVVGVGSAVAKGAKAIAATASIVSKIAKLGKIIGRAAIGGLNPVDGLGSLGLGLLKLGRKGVGATYKGAKHLRVSHRNVNLLELAKKPDIAEGTYKAADSASQSQGLAQFDKATNKWYAYDPRTKQVYGKALEPFTPLDGLAPRSPDVNVLRNSHASSSRHRYDPLDRSSRAPLKGVTHPDHLPEGEYVTHINGARSDAHFTPSTKAATREKFNREMNDFYRRMTSSELPKRPVIPAITGEIKPSDLLGKALDASDGLVLGERHNQTASFQVLYDNVGLFKQKGVKKLYMEGTFYNSNMELVNDGIGFLGDGVTPRFPSFKQLLKKFSDEGIEVVPLDHTYLTRHKDEREVFKAANQSQQHVPRLKEFNYYATQTIRQNSAGEKWIALVGNAHMNTSQGVPGVAELTGGIGVGVLKKNGTGQSVGLRSTAHIPDPARVIGANDWPGDLQIFHQTRTPPGN